MTASWRRETRASAAGGGDADERPLSRRLQRPLGQGVAMQRWLQQARAGTLPHGLLVEGVPGGGKSTVIDWFTAALLCPSELDTDGPCGVCRTCMRVANAVHPDVHLLDLAHDDADKKAWKKSYYVITVEQVRHAQETLQRLAVEGRARVLVIADADCLQDEGQNALLKTLEEPGTATFVLLEASRPEQLLPTVRSRLQRLRVLPLDDATIRRELIARVPERSAHFDGAVAVAGGSLGRALLACTERVVQVHDLVRAALQQINRLRPVATAHEALKGVKERPDRIDAARTFLWLLRAELSGRLRGLAAASADTYLSASAEPWTTWLELTLAAERDLDLQIPPEQVLTACLAAFVDS